MKKTLAFILIVFCLVPLLAQSITETPDVAKDPTD